MIETINDSNREVYLRDSAQLCTPRASAARGAAKRALVGAQRINEIQAHSVQCAFGLECIGLRYFNVFGPRQDPEGPYAAVIPRWMDGLLHDRACEVYGDGENSRDFCDVANAVQANLLAAAAPASATNAVYNVAVGARTTLRELFFALQGAIAVRHPAAARAPLVEKPERAGDVRHSLADITRARDALGYAPTHDLASGVRETVEAWRG